MHRYKNLIILGTSHIAIQSVKQVENIINKYKPQIIALELDSKRLRALLSKKRKFTYKDVKKLGVKGFLFHFIGAWAERYLGKKVGTKPGAEMKEAIKLAKQHKLKIALIDQDIQITIRKLIKRLTTKEKLTFLKDLILPFSFKKQNIKFNLKKVPKQKTIERLIKQVKKRYPSVHNTLVTERNQIMANNLNKLILKYPDSRIVAIIGAGHEKGIIGELKLIQNKRQF